MKITANIPDHLIKDLKGLTQKRTLTEALITALSEWLASKELQQKHKELRENPLEFNFSAHDIREVNRK